MEIISGVYKITNTVTKDFYIGSSNDVKRRFIEHKKPSVWKKCPNSQLYKDMKKYGRDKFDFQVIEEVESGSLKEKEQHFIEKMHPTYNKYRAKCFDIEMEKEYHKEYNNKYYSLLCFYNGETMTLSALSNRFKRQGIPHPTLEAKKYLLQ